MAHGSHVDVRLGALEFLLGHEKTPESLARPDSG
jgi:hypothetical protein